MLRLRNNKLIELSTFLLLFVLRRLVVNLIFYGFVFYISDLPGSPYLNLVIMYVVIGIPGYLLSWITIQK